jgi:diguanylate cyclase
MPHYPESKDAAQEYLRLALMNMGKLEAPPNPINYAIFYEHASGRNPALTEALDELIDSGGPFTNEIGQELYQRFVSTNGMSRLIEAEQTLRRIMAENLSELAAADRQLNRYEDSVKGQVGRIEDGLGPEALAEVLQQIVSQTGTLLSSNQALQQQLNDSQQRTRALGQELEKAREQATIDALTGLANRQALAAAFELAVSIVPRIEKCILMIDIDHFKKVNDTHGHVVGDGVLKLTAEALLKCCKGKDTVARYGGEEFAVLLPDTSLPDAVTLAENIRQFIARRHFVKTGTKESIGHITVSIGVARHRADESLTVLIERADRALYAAKEGGRNRVVSEPES